MNRRLVDDEGDLIEVNKVERISENPQLVSVEIIDIGAFFKTCDKYNRVGLSRLYKRKKEISGNKRIRR